MNTALTIAGSDCSGGAGIQADLKTFTAFGVYGMSAVTAVVAENTVGVQEVFDLPAGIIEQQIKSVVDDIRVDAIKIGMLSNPVIVELVAEKIREYNLKNIVIDPVMVAKSGDPLLKEEARIIIKNRLLPLATVITPNLYEAEVLLGGKIKSLEQMKEAAVELGKIGCAWVVVKGGHLTGEKDAIDVVYNGRDFQALHSPFIDTKNTHGTGCTFSSAIAAGIAKGYDVSKAINRAKEYITSAIADNVPLGGGYGPTNHLTGVNSKW